MDASQIVVIDGDTVEVQGQRIRLVGYDAPEIGDARCSRERQRGEEAATALKTLIAEGRVELELHDLRRHDRYARVLGRLRVDGVDVAEILIREGLAVPYALGFARENWCAALAR